MALASPARGSESSPATYRVAPIGPMLAEQLKAELRKLWRVPSFTIVGLAFPVIFFTFFGLPNVHKTLYGVNAGVYLLASFSAYGAINIALFSFGVSIAIERGQKQQLLMRAAPVRPAIYLLARVIAALLFTFVALLVLYLFARFVGKVELATTTWLNMTGRELIGLLPFIAAGFAVGYLATPAAAAPLINLIYLPLSFASGLFVPLEQMPHFIQQIAPYTPTYNYAQLAWSAIGANTGSLTRSIIWLTAYGIAFVALAIWGYNREQARTFA
jgi:ABC-2 type transport system permease protein